MVKTHKSGVHNLSKHPNVHKARQNVIWIKTSDWTIFLKNNEKYALEVVVAQRIEAQEEASISGQKPQKINRNLGEITQRSNLEASSCPLFFVIMYKKTLVLLIYTHNKKFQIIIPSSSFLSFYNGKAVKSETASKKCLCGVMGRSSLEDTSFL